MNAFSSPSLLLSASLCFSFCFLSCFFFSSLLASYACSSPSSQPCFFLLPLLALLHLASLSFFSPRCEKVRGKQRKIDSISFLSSVAYCCDRWRNRERNRRKSWPLRFEYFLWHFSKNGFEIKIHRSSIVFVIVKNDLSISSYLIWTFRSEKDNGHIKFSYFSCYSHALFSFYTNGHFFEFFWIFFYFSDNGIRTSFARADRIEKFRVFRSH